MVERAAGPGGKMRTVPSPAGPVDAGPTVFTLRHVFDGLFESVGESLDAHVTLRPLEILARHDWRGAPRLDLYADAARSREAIGDFAGAGAARSFDAFRARARRLFAALEGPVMTAADPGPLSVALATLGRGPRLLADMAPGTTLAGLLGREFEDPRLAQLFARYATYVGGSPFRSPAILALIWDAEAQGVYEVAGGMHALARAIEAAARARGARFLYGCAARAITVENGAATGVEFESGVRVDADAVLFNGDPAALAEGRLGEPVQIATPPRPEARRSLSAWVWSFSAEAGDAPLAHHNVAFSDDYRAEFADIARGRLPRDPTLYLCAQDRGGAARTAGAERFQIIMNAPATGDGPPPTQEERSLCETRVFDRLREAGVPLAPPRGAEALTTPTEFAAMFPGSGGALYGTDPHRLTATFRRPRARSRVPGLFLAGGAVHPGPGVPMAALSGRLAAAAILLALGSTSASRRTAMPGGMSTGSPTMANAPSRSSAS